MNSDVYDEAHFKGKTADELREEIQHLKDEMERLKDILEHPNYHADKPIPDEYIQIQQIRDALNKATAALTETGAPLKQTLREVRGEVFQKNIPYIARIVYAKNSMLGKSEHITVTVEDEQVFITRKNADMPEPVQDAPIPTDIFLEKLSVLHIGEWQPEYSPARFGFLTCDGAAWDLTFYFSSGCRPFSIRALNAEPYNFFLLKELLGI